VADLVVVDTDLVIDFLRGRGPGAHLTRRLVLERRLRVTAMTSFELRVGADFLARKDQILRLFRSRTVPLDLASTLRAGEVASTLQASGTGIGFVDCLQAGICLRYGLPLATRNRKHFERVEGLQLIDVEAA
jgi:tRNA(fMet)-specific endonuclease VapC